MDNRWRFLYYVHPELWGRMWKAVAGKEKTGPSEVGERKANPPLNPKT